MIDAQATGLSYLPLVFTRNAMVQYVSPLSATQYPNRVQLRYETEVYVQNGLNANTYEMLPVLRGSERPARQINGVLVYPGAEFDVRYLLDDRLTRSLPAFGQSKISLCDGLTRRFYTRARRSNGVTLVDTLTSVTQVAIKGGIAETDFRAHGGRFFSDWQGKFLTWTRNPRPVRLNQPEYLYFLTNATPAPTQLRLRVRINGTAVITLDTLTTVSPFVVYCLPVGPANPALLPHVVNGVDYYEVWVSDQSNARISDVRRYDLDRTHRRNVRYVLFNNSLGCYDTLTCLGRGTETLKVSRNTYERYDDYQASPSFAERIISDVTGERELTLNTGPLDEAPYLAEIMLAEEVFLATDRAFVPLLRQGDSLNTLQDNESLIARPLTFRYANRERNYSRLPATESTAGRATAWRPVATACELTETGLRTGKLLTTMLELFYPSTNEAVLPPVVVPNVPTDAAYVAPVNNSPTCAVTPFLNTAISRQSTVVRGNCATNRVGTTALIQIPAGTFGSELSQVDAQAKAEALYASRNTQEWVDQNGTCQTAAFLNTRISGLNAFYKNSCDSNQVGSRPEITIPAGTYGSNVSQADAQARAQAAWDAQNTQAWSNSNGECLDATIVHGVGNQVVVEVRRQSDNSYVLAPRWTGGFGAYNVVFKNTPSGTTVSGQTLLVPIGFYDTEVVATFELYHNGIFAPHGQYAGIYRMNVLMH